MDQYLIFILEASNDLEAVGRPLLGCLAQQLHMRKVGLGRSVAQRSPKRIRDTPGVVCQRRLVARLGRYVRGRLDREPRRRQLIDPQLGRLLVRVVHRRYVGAGEDDHTDIRGE